MNAKEQRCSKKKYSYKTIETEHEYNQLAK